jgi:hypothetical protein
LKLCKEPDASAGVQIGIHEVPLQDVSVRVLRRGTERRIPKGFISKTAFTPERHIPVILVQWQVLHSIPEVGALLRVAKSTPILFVPE